MCIIDYLFLFPVDGNGEFSRCDISLYSLSMFCIIYALSVFCNALSEQGIYIISGCWLFGFPYLRVSMSLNNAGTSEISFFPTLIKRVFERDTWIRNLAACYWQAARFHIDASRSKTRFINGEKRKFVRTHLDGRSAMNWYLSILICHA